MKHVLASNPDIDIRMVFQSPKSKDKQRLVKQHMKHMQIKLGITQCS
jgi:hypothetical protein